MVRRCVIVALAVLAAPAWAQEARRDTPPPPAKPAPRVTRPPELVEAAAPIYPAEALAAGKKADVKVRITIDATGAVTKVSVIEPVGDGFDEAAVEAVQQYIFRPAEIDGVPAAITVETTIHFEIAQELTEAPPPPPPTTTEAVPGHAGDATKPVTVKGLASERGTRRDLAGIIVSITELSLDAVTDERGEFFFHGVAPGKYTVLAVGDRHDRFRRPIEVGAGEVLDLRLWMRPRGGNPYETVVEGEREVLEVTRRTLQRQQLTSVPGTFGDPIRVIQSLPGLVRTPFVLGALIIRGSNPDDTGIFIDGHRVPLLFHFLGGPSILNAELVESIDLYPGGFPARFGRGHGGVVAIESRASKSDGVHGSADVDLLDAGGYLRTPITKKVSVAIAGRRSYVDQFLDYVLPEPDPGATRVVVPIYYDYQARADADLGRDGKLAIFALGSSDQLDVISADAEEEESLALNTRIDFFRLIASYKRPLAKDFTLTLSPAIGRDSITFAGGQAASSAPYTSLGVTQNTFSYRMRAMGKPSKRTVVDLGIDLESRVTRYDALAPVADDIREGDDIDIPPELLSLGTEQLAVGFHADVAIDLWGRLRLIPGIRADLYSLDGEERSSVDPRLVARLGVGEGWTLKSYAGVFHQPPQPEAFDSRFGNPSVGLERGYHFGFGGEWKPTRDWSFDGEIYYADRNRLVVFANDADVEGGAVDPLQFANRGSSESFGLEVLLKREVTENAYGWLSYTYSHSRRRTRPSSPSAPTGLDQPHTLNAVASWKPGRGNWELGARFRLSSGRPDTPIAGATFDADAGNYEDVEGRFRSIRNPFFHQLDVRAERSWLFRTWSLGAYLDIQNVYAVDNVEATEYDYRYRESAPVTGVPFLPTIGVRGQW